MTLTERLAYTLKGILEMVGRHTVRHHALGPLAILLANRFARTRARFETLLRRWQTNTLPAARKRAAQNRAKRSAPRAAIPTARYWLRKIFPDTAQYSGQIETLLNDPETRELLKAAPQAGRLLRPLARMFGLEIPEHLRLPKKPAIARPPARVAPKRPTPKPEPHRSSSPPHLRLRVPGIRSA